MPNHFSARWQAFRATKQADYDRIYDEVVAERGHPSGSIGGWGIRMEISKRFEAFLRAHYSDEITIVMQMHRIIWPSRDRSPRRKNGD